MLLSDALALATGQGALCSRAAQRWAFEPGMEPAES